MSESVSECNIGIDAGIIFNGKLFRVFHTAPTVEILDLLATWLAISREMTEAAMWLRLK